MSKTGTVYTETVVHLAPASHADQAPYQVVIVEYDDGSRVTGRLMAGEANVQIGDQVSLAETRDHVPYFHRGSGPEPLQ